MALDRAFGFIGHRPDLLGRVRDAIITLFGLLILVGVVLALTLLPRIARELGFPEFHFGTGVGWIDWVLFAVGSWVFVLGVFRWGPSKAAPVSWKSPIAIAVALWFLGVSAGVGVYVGLSTTIGAAIAAFGAPMVVLLWLYLSFIGLLLGAEMQMYLTEERPTTHE